MTFENNYYFAGTTAIIYNVYLDRSDYGTFQYENSTIIVQSGTNVSDIGVMYKKASEDNWEYISLIDQNLLENNTFTWNSIISPVYVNLYKANNNFEGLYSLNWLCQKYSTYLMPLRVVIKNLTPNTEYNIKSYYIKNQVEYYYNECSVTTQSLGTTQFNCYEVTGSSDERNIELKNTLNLSCEIFNSICTINDSVRTLGTGSFKATLMDSLNGAGANSNMEFIYGYDVSVCVHEMAHNIMKQIPYESEYRNGIDVNAEEISRQNSLITKFMEFATNTPKATWRWLGYHNYPIISSYRYGLVDNYLVAAACQVSYFKNGLLPNGYTQVEYIQSTNTGGQYIDLNIKLYETLNTNYDIAIKFNIIGQGLNNTTNAAIFACQDPNISPWPGTFIRRTANSNNVVGRYIGGTAKDNTIGQVNTIIELPIQTPPNKNVTNLSNSGKTHSYGTSLFCIFGDTNNTARDFTEAKLYYFKLFVEGVLVRNMIPCISPNNVVGLFDAAGRKFYSSPNGATFVAGPVVS